MPMQTLSLCWWETRAICGTFARFPQRRPRPLRVRRPFLSSRCVKTLNLRLLMLTTIGENHLSFIETSALDASNVELAFQNILTGMSTHVPLPCAILAHINPTPSHRDLPHCFQQGPRQRRRRPGHDRCRHQHLSQQACRGRFRKGREVLLNSFFWCLRQGRSVLKAKPMRRPYWELGTGTRNLIRGVLANRALRL